MPRVPKPFPHKGWFRTNVGGRTYTMDVAGIGAAAGDVPGAVTESPAADPEQGKDEDSPLRPAAAATEPVRELPARPEGGFKVVVVAPPWTTMSVKAIRALPVPALAARDAVVCLWANKKYVADALSTWPLLGSASGPSRARRAAE